MWEFSISVNQQNSKVSNFIYSKLKSQANEIGFVVTVFATTAFCNVVCACEEYDIDRVKFLISECLSEAICVHMKENFLNENLKLKNTSEINLIALKNALINFDKETDSYIVNKYLVIDKNINLESFFVFKLKFLKEKWSELVRIANENSTCLVSNDTFIELLRFLIDNLETSSEDVYLYYCNNTYMAFDENYNEINLNFETKESVESQLISRIISLCPKKIHLYSNEENRVFYLINQIFEKRVIILPCEAIEKNIHKNRKN